MPSKGVPTTIWLKKSEKAVIAKAAAEFNLPLSTYMRAIILQHAKHVTDETRNVVELQKARTYEIVEE